MSRSVSIWLQNMEEFIYRGLLYSVQSIVKKDPGMTLQDSLATAGTNFTKPGAQNKGDLCKVEIPSTDRDRIQLTREALALLEDVLEGGLEEAVAHLVPVPVAAQHTMRQGCQKSLPN